MKVVAASICMLLCFLTMDGSVHPADAQNLLGGGFFFGPRMKSVPLEDTSRFGAYDPNRNYAAIQRICRNARSGMDKDECQYGAERMISAMQDCTRDGNPQAATCARLLPKARAMLARVNRDAVLLDHRAGQRDAQRRAWEADQARGPKGIMNYPNYQRTCTQLNTGQYSCY